MIEQDGFVTTYDSHKQPSSESTQLDIFKFEADAVYRIVKSMYERTTTEEFKKCFGDWMTEADFNEIHNEVMRLYNKISILNYNVAWYEGGKKF